MGKLPGGLGWQLSFHVLLFFNILYGYTRGKCGPIENSAKSLLDLALL